MNHDLEVDIFIIILKGLLLTKSINYQSDSKRHAVDMFSNKVFIM